MFQRQLCSQAALEMCDLLLHSATQRWLGFLTVHTKQAPQAYTGFAACDVHHKLPQAHMIAANHPPMPVHATYLHFTYLQHMPW